MKIYLDTSALNRIFDDQSQGRIYLESTSMELIFLLIENNRLEMVSSEVIEAETDQNPYDERRFFIEEVLKKATKFQTLNEEIVARAEEIEATMKIKGMDALHLACAEALAVDYFITCDDRMIKKYHGAIALKTPTDFANQEI